MRQPNQAGQLSRGSLPVLESISRRGYGLHVGQHSADGTLIDIGNQRIFAQIPFPFSGFFGQDMRGKCPAAANFSASGRFEPFGCASVCFHFRHG